MQENSAEKEFKNPYPVPYHETFEIFDSSKLSTFMKCPRLYFFDYILGWRPEEGNFHFIFGEAWHRGVEEILKAKKNKIGFEQSAKNAVLAFDDYFERNITPEMQINMRGKNPAQATQALIAYARDWENKEVEVLGTELSGEVMVGTRPDKTERLLTFRCDGVLDIPNKGIVLAEHKTTGRKSNAWAEQWKTSYQIKTYVHALSSHYGQENIWGAIVDGAIFRSKDYEFMEVPVRITSDIMQVWIEEVNFWLSMLEREMLILGDDSPDNTTMISFPKNPTACCTWNACPFIDFCAFWSNPLKNCSTPPPGYSVQRWNPKQANEDKEVEIRQAREKLNRKTIDDISII
jgi:hypothetical protein